ncbi:Hypothetical protein GLP15_1292 [Giardia lamblia P15]|uniref:Uncharacterized protein n=1 Tax=Giardia intestinalis (strain P15) TaxID=658858 RepID=E1F8B1_GIAIA|nr:Hypothetical protein GLP15_1292 [Giardia lamblia P15]
MTEQTEATPTSLSSSVEGKMGSKVISVLCDSVRCDTEDAIHNAALSILLDYHTHKDSWEAASNSSSCDVSITKTKINKHTVVNVIEQGPASSATIISSNGTVDQNDPSMNESTPLNLNSSQLPVDYEPDFIADTQSTKRPILANTLRSPHIEKPEIVKAAALPNKRSVSIDHADIPRKSFKLSSASAALPLSRPEKKNAPNQNMTIPCQTGALHGPSGVRNVQCVKNPSQKRKNITTEVILLPSTRGSSEPLRQKTQQAELVTRFPPRNRSPIVSDPTDKSVPLASKDLHVQNTRNTSFQPQQQQQQQQQRQEQQLTTSPERQSKPKADELETSPCDTPTYSNPMSFRKEVPQRQAPAPQMSTDQKKQEEPQLQGDVNPQVICLPTIHRYNSPQLLSSSRKPSRKSQDLEGSSISSTSSCQPANQSSPRLPQPSNPSLKEHVSKPIKQKQHADVDDIDPGEVWPRYDAHYANYLRSIGKGMGPWDGNLDTTWDLSTIDYTVYDDELGQLPINTANPKYVSTKLSVNPQGCVIPPGLPPVQDYEYEEGECLPNGAIADGYAVHYFKQSHYMGSGQASNNYRAINSDGVTYDYNKPQQPYLNGIMYRQQYGNYVTNNPYSQSAINCGRNYYYQQRLHEQRIYDVAIQEQQNQYLCSLHQYAQSTEAIMPTSYRQRYQESHPDE